MKLLYSMSLAFAMLLQYPAQAADKNRDSTKDIAGMVLDLRGSAQLTENGHTGELQLLAYLKPGMQVKLAAGSKASLSLYATHSVYQLSGPSLVEIGKDKLRMLQGTAPVVKNMAEKLVAAAQTADIMPGAYRLRTIAPRIVLQIPENQSVLLGRQARFCWQASEPAKYDISVIEEPDHVLAGATVTDTCWSLPAATPLEYGKNYRWTVSYTSPSSKKTYDAEAAFSMLDQAGAEQLASLKPAASAPIEEWLLYAAVLQNRQISDEARTAWQFIAAQRPDLQQLHEQSAQQKQ